MNCLHKTLESSVNIVKTVKIVNAVKTVNIVNTVRTVNIVNSQQIRLTSVVQPQLHPWAWTLVCWPWGSLRETCERSSCP